MIRFKTWRMVLLVTPLLLGCRFEVAPVADTQLTSQDETVAVDDLARILDGAALDLFEPRDAERDFRLIPAEDLRPERDLFMPTIVRRINVDGVAHVGVDYPGNWAADPGLGGVCGPNQTTVLNPIHGTNDPELFSGEIWGNPVTCSVGGLQPGRYYVNLYFAEIYWGPGCAGTGVGTGARVFDIVLDGTTVLTDFDIFSEGRCAASTTDTSGHPVVKHFTVDLNSNHLDIALPATVNNGKISAIEIISQF